MAEPERRAILERIDELKSELDVLKKRVDGGLDDELLPDGKVTLLECRVADQDVAFMLDSVGQVVFMCELRPLPEAPAWVLGLVDYHGEALPVLDVTARLQRRRRTPQVSDFIVLCRHHGRSLGLAVQDVLRVREVATDELQRPPAAIPHAPYVLRSLTRPGRMLLLLSIDRLVALSGIPEEGPQS